MNILMWITAVLAAIGAIMWVALRVTRLVRERLRIDLERRLAQVRLQQITSQAMLQMMRERRRE